jgi:hypothetical protein
MGGKLVVLVTYLRLRVRLDKHCFERLHGCGGHCRREGIRWWFPQSGPGMRLLSVRREKVAIRIRRGCIFLG